jgi:hypothetical protein
MVNVGNQILLSGVQNHMCSICHVYSFGTLSLTAVSAVAYKPEIRALNIGLWSFATRKFIGKFNKNKFHRRISLLPDLK